jgi:WW domain
MASGSSSRNPSPSDSGPSLEPSDAPAKSEETREESSDEADNHSLDEQPPLPDEEAPPLPDEKPPDDGWEPVWDANAHAFYFYNRLTQKMQWENPRVPESSKAPVVPSSSADFTPGLGSHDRTAGAGSSSATSAAAAKKGVAGGYNPAIHGDYDPNADYAQADPDSDDDRAATDAATAANAVMYTATGTFNRFTGKWQNSAITPENFNDENKSKRQMNAFFDVDSAANIHDGRSLKAERQNKKFSRKEIKAFKEKRREKKEEKRRAWLRD